MTAVPGRLIGVAMLLAVVAVGAAALAWQIQDWRYGRQLAEQARLQGETLSELASAAATHAGGQGLIALAACQTYAKEVSIRK